MLVAIVVMMAFGLIVLLAIYGCANEIRKVHAYESEIRLQHMNIQNEQAKIMLDICNRQIVLLQKIPMHIPQTWPDREN